MYHAPKDILWKAIIEDCIVEFCHYFFPVWAESMADFSKSPEFLDKELGIINRGDFTQEKIVDKLVKIYTKNGGEQWILLHIEVQGYDDANFAQRMFTYAYRIYDKYQKEIIPLVIYTNDNRNYMPDKYESKYLGKGFTYDFHTFKLVDKTVEGLMIPNNPFSIVMVTAKKAMKKINLIESNLFAWKKELIDAFKKANYDKQEIHEILEFIRYYAEFREESSLIALNEHISKKFNYIKNMGITETITQIIKQKGIEEGRTQGIEEGLQKGRTQGIEEGLQKGRTQGIEEGRTQGILLGIKRALKRGKLSIEEIAEDFEVTTDYVLKIQEETRSHE